METYPLEILVLLTAALAFVSLGGAFYEFSVVDPFWPRRPDLIQPSRGGISRKRFWIAAHTAFELALVVAVGMAWNAPAIRVWLLMALASHAAIRIWSAFDFIPKALRFESATPDAFSEAEARSWTLRSKLRLPLDFVTCGAMLVALLTAAKA